MPDPQELFDTLTKELTARNRQIDLLDAYYRGNHPLPPVLPGQAAEFIRLQRLCRANWCRLVVNSSANDLKIQGVRRGTGQAGIDEGLRIWNKYWQPNNLDVGARKVFRRALSCERGFMSVWMDTDEAGEPVGVPKITPESPRQMIVAYEPGSTTERIAALKSFTGIDGVRRQCLWTGDKVYKRQWQVGADGAVKRDASGDGVWIPWADTRLGGPTGPNPMIEGYDNPYGVSVVEFLANPDDEGVPTSDIADVIPIQDRINHTLLQRVFSAENQSYPQRVLIGEKVQRDSNNQPVNPVDAGPDRVTQLSSEHAKIDQWDAATADGFLRSIEADIQELTSISSTAPTATIAQLANIGAESLKALKESHVQKVSGYQDDFGDSSEEVLRLAMSMADDPAKDDQALEVVWAGLTDPSLTELGDFFSKAAGLPLPAQLQITGMFSPQQIDEYVQMQEQALHAAALMADMAAQTASQTPAEPPAAVPTGQ